MGRRKDYYEAGDVLCDMHDHFKYLPDNLEVIKVMNLQKESGAHDYVQDFLRGIYDQVKHGNKYLTVVGEAPDGGYIAVYSYDDHIFGMVQLRKK